MLCCSYVPTCGMSIEAPCSLDQYWCLRTSVGQRSGEVQCAWNPRPGDLWPHRCRAQNCSNACVRVCCAALCGHLEDASVPFGKLTASIRRRCCVVCCPLRFDLRHFSASLIWSDILHVVFLGFGKDFVGSVIVVMAQASHWGRGISADNRLRHAGYSFKAWCQSEKHHTSLSTMNRKVLKWKSSSYYPNIMAKGSDVKLLLSWLQIASLTFTDHPMADNIQAACFCLCRSGPQPCVEALNCKNCAAVVCCCQQHL